MSAAINTGFIIGPGIGGFLAELSTRTPFYVAAVMGGIAAILSFIFLKEPTETNLAKEKSVEKIGFKKGLQKILTPMYLLCLFNFYIDVRIGHLSNLYSVYLLIINFPSRQRISLLPSLGEDYWSSCTIIPF